MIGQSIMNSLRRLTSDSRSNSGTRSGVIVTPVVEPVIRYLNVFLADLVAKTAEITVCASQNFPPLPGYRDEVPLFTQVTNRLKVLSNLDPLTYKKIVNGSFEHKVRDRCYCIVATFSDCEGDPWCRLAVAQGIAKPREG